jgi:hypothetical protein
MRVCARARGAETWRLRKVDRKYLRIFECAAEGCRRSVGPIVRDTKKYYVESKDDRYVLYKIKKRRLIGLGPSDVGTAC